MGPAGVLKSRKEQEKLPAAACGRATWTAPGREALSKQRQAARGALQPAQQPAALEASGECWVLRHKRGLDSKGLSWTHLPEGQERVTLSQRAFPGHLREQGLGRVWWDCPLPNPEPAKAPSVTQQPEEEGRYSRVAPTGQGGAPAGIHGHSQRAPSLGSPGKALSEAPSSFLGVTLQQSRGTQEAHGEG